MDSGRSEVCCVLGNGNTNPWSDPATLQRGRRCPLELVVPMIRLTSAGDRIPCGCCRRVRFSVNSVACQRLAMSALKPMGNDHFDGLRIPQAREQRDLHCEVSEGRLNTRMREYVLLRACQRLAGSMTAVCWKPELAHHTDTYPYSFSSKNNTRHKSCMHKSAMVIVRRRRSELSRWERCQLQRRHLDMVVEACSSSCVRIRISSVGTS